MELREQSLPQFERIPAWKKGLIPLRLRRSGGHSDGVRSGGECFPEPQGEISLTEF